MQAFNDGLTDAIVNSKNLGDVFKNVAKQIIADLIRIAIQQQIVAAFGGGGGGIFGSLFGSGPQGGGVFGFGAGSHLKNVGTKISSSVFGRASGGPVEAGRLYRINESGIEGFVPAMSGTIIPTGQMNALASRGGNTSQVVTVRLALSGEIDARIDQRSAGVAVEVYRQALPATVDLAANETLRRANRPKV